MKPPGARRLGSCSGRRVPHKLRAGPVTRETDRTEADMTIVLDHTIVPARDNEASARFFAHIFGLDYEGTQSHFAPVRVNSVRGFAAPITFSHSARVTS